MTETLIIFSRYPEAGKTKTRMIPALGAEGAAELQKHLSEHTLRTARELQSEQNLNLEVHFAGGDRQLMAEWLGQDLNYIPQVAGDLGYKMCSAFERAFSLGSQKAITIGIDCPDIDRAILESAFNSLSQHDLTIGAAADGGYYLIGLNRPIPELFADIAWGTDQVLNQTKAIAHKLNIDTHYLPVLADVDRPEDLAIWQKHT